MVSPRLEIEVGVRVVIWNWRALGRLKISGSVAAPPQLRACEVEGTDFAYQGDEELLLDDVEVVDPDALGPALGDDKGFSRR